MKKNSINETTYDYQFLKNKLKEIGDNGTEDDKIRLHRAISWLKCTEENENNPDIKFISLWIAFNACYAYDDAHLESFTEKQHFKDFILKLVKHDTQELFFNILWKKFSGPIRTLIENQYADKYFWVAQRENHQNWERSFKSTIEKGSRYLANQEVDKLLEIVLDRLYTVRNQLLHGGATYKSKVNRAQVKDAGNILSFLMPVIINIMIENIDDDWGPIKYPVIS